MPKARQVVKPVRIGQDGNDSHGRTAHDQNRFHILIRQPHSVA